MSELASKKLMDAMAQFRRLKRGKKNSALLKPSDMMFLMKMIEMESAGDEISGSSLSTALGVSKPFVTKCINDFVRAGIVERMAEGHDRRIVSVSITPKGKEIIELAHKQFMAAIDGLVQKLGEERSLLLAELMEESYSFLETFHEVEQGGKT